MKSKNKNWSNALTCVGLVSLLLFNGCKKNDDEPVTTVTDIDGNVYHTVTIGTQVWMVENLRVTKFNDGTAIPSVTDNTEWSNLVTSGYGWYNNELANKTTYGGLYNWYAVSSGKLCPPGWHVPSNAEWITLIGALGGESVAGGKMKETGTTHWHTPNSDATNESGFLGLPGGLHYYDGSFLSITENGSWWSSTEENSPTAWLSWLVYANGQCLQGPNFKACGLSVRCVKN